MKHKKLIWTILFVLYVLYVFSELALFAYFLVTNEPGSSYPVLIDYLYEIVMLITLVGYYGFITSKKYLHKVFWQALFIFLVTTMAYEVSSGIINHGQEYIDLFMLQPSFLLLYVAVLPAFYAIYKYSFKSSEIWV
jgi:hypothetical protein